MYLIDDYSCLSSTSKTKESFYKWQSICLSKYCFRNKGSLSAIKSMIKVCSLKFWYPFSIERRSFWLERLINCCLLLKYTLTSTKMKFKSERCSLFLATILRNIGLNGIKRNMSTFQRLYRLSTRRHAYNMHKNWLFKIILSEIKLIQSTNFNFSSDLNKYSR